ncbi:MAG: hypothetical protein ABIN69_05075 [Aestuariivirga sp.]
MAYTVKSVLNGAFAGSQLFKAEDLEQAKEKAEQMVQRGHTVEIWDNKGTKVFTLEPP